MAGLRAAQKQMTRTLLLSTALRLFTEKGYASTTVDDIAAAAGTTRVTFYAHFPSRADLMRALISELNEKLGRVEDESHRSTARDLVGVVADGSPERLRAWLGATAGAWETVRPYTTAAFTAAAIDPELRELVDAWLEEAIDDVEEGLTEADRFAPETRHVRGVLAMVQLDHVARHWTDGHWGVDHDQIVDLLTETWGRLLND
jgi:AcrR family transcriptional regulator